MTTNNPKKILLVDDNVLFLKLLNKAFTNSGFDCVTAESAELAMALLRSKPLPDIILSDYNMPQMNGLEFRRALISDGDFTDIPFVFLTQFSDEQLMVEGLDLKAIDYIIKNTPVNIIISKVNNILHTVDKQHELSEQELKKAATTLNIKSIPGKTPAIKGFTLHFWHQAYEGIPGGDFIDFIKVNDRYTFIVLGDVMGKKWMAWFFTIGFLSYIRSAVRFSAFNEEYSTATILYKVNNVICFDDVLKDILSSLSLLLIDSESDKVTYSGAGDLPLLHYSAAEQKFTPINSSGLLLGLFPDGRYDEQEIILKTEDKLFAFTDGMIDFRDLTGKKSDYDLFSGSLLPFLTTPDYFDKIKSEILTKDTDNRVDDSSIIILYKN